MVVRANAANAGDLSNAPSIMNLLDADLHRVDGKNGCHCHDGIPLHHRPQGFQITVGSSFWLQTPDFEIKLSVT